VVSFTPCPLHSRVKESRQEWDRSSVVPKIRSDHWRKKVSCTARILIGIRTYYVSEIAYISVFKPSGLSRGPTQ
jgi:hypothetical protein